MKYSFMSFSCPELSLGEMLSLAKRLGYDGLEPRISREHAHGIEFDANATARRDARKQSADAGVAMGCIATSCRYADPATREKSVEDTLKSIDLAGDVGAPCIRVFGGPLAEGVSREDAIGLLVESMRAVADHAKQRGVTVCMETHDDWCDPTHLAEVMKRVDHPAIAVNWDIMHPVRTAGWTIEDSYRVLKPWVRHLHVHDGDKTSLKPIGEGIVDHRRAIELIKADGYDGFISGEWIGWEPYETHLPRELATMKQYEAEA